MVLFCQMDVSGRSENDPAAETLASNILSMWPDGSRLSGARRFTSEKRRGRSI
jgi:hypothetical protein